MLGFFLVASWRAHPPDGLRFCPLARPQLPYDQGTTDPGTELSFLRENQDVIDLRDQYGADLVVLVGNFPGTCGLG